MGFLLGDRGGPILPRSWDRISWPVQVPTPGERRRVLVNGPQLNSVEGISPSSLPSDLPHIANALVGRLAEIKHWRFSDLGAILVVEDWEERKVSELPLLVATVEVLRELSIGPSSEIEEILRLAADEFLEVEHGSVALLDLGIALESWLGTQEWDPHHSELMRARTLKELALAVARRVLDREVGGSLEPEDIVRRRGWGCPRATLEAIGKDRDLTRERIRQLFTVVEPRLGLRRWPLPPNLAPMVAVSDEPSGGPTFSEATESWDVSSVVDLLRAIGQSDLAQTIEDWVLQQNPTIDPEQRSAVLSARSHLGFIDLRGMREDPALPDDPDDLEALVRICYSRVFRSGDFLLAATETRSTVERICGQQFGISSHLSVGELREGIERVGRKRGAAPPPPDEVLVDLLEQAGAVVRDGDLLTGPPIPLQDESLQKWLVDLLRAAPGQVLHTEEIMRAALDRGQNISSLTNYLTYEPMVRRIGRRGLVRLVGQYPTEESMQVAARVAEAKHHPTKVNVEYGAAIPHLLVSVGSNLLNTGVISATSDMVTIWPQTGASVTCSCGLDFGGVRALTGEGKTSSGWSTMLSHAAVAHGLREGTVVRMEVDGSRVSILAFE